MPAVCEYPGIGIVVSRVAAARIALTLPGRVLAATPPAEIAGTRVAWKLPIVDYVSRPRSTVSVRWARG